ncbi:MAG: tRNA threonylcarbamoyladenosine dehydratase [Lachnospiraceae bacterium]|nr:tRNA threonylcarbamoyladenosine dehydratase [Lachnospiraceae bacterium]
MDKRFFRNEIILGADKVANLRHVRVAIFGVGGVGGYAAEAIARAGVGNIVLIDKDEVDVTNINRQIIALSETVGRPKVDVLKERIESINPEANVDAVKCFYLPDTADMFDFSIYDYVLDCVDTVTAKISIIEKAKEAGVPVISAMGAGNKLYPEMFEVADIYKTSVCPLAKVMRKELKKRGIDSLKVVYSKEERVVPEIPEGYDTEEKLIGSVSFVPGVMGLIMAGQVIRDLCSIS